MQINICNRKGFNILSINLFAVLIFLGCVKIQAQVIDFKAEKKLNILKYLENIDKQYDEREQLLLRPFSSPGYHTTLTHGFVHPTRDSLGYALGLLDTYDPSRIDRALAIIRKVISLQDATPTSKTYGLWSWFLEEPLEKMSPPDFNWADFNGVLLLQISRDHHDRLPLDLVDKVNTAILRACAAIKKRNVGPSYTNISIMGAYVTLIAGEYLKNTEYKSYGYNRIKDAYAYFKKNGYFEEYNSPTYTIVALKELTRLHKDVTDQTAQVYIEPLLYEAWRELAVHFHNPTRQWSGPSSRAYSSLLNETTLTLIQNGTHGLVQFNAKSSDLDEFRLPLDCPKELIPLFGELKAPRILTETLIKRNNTVGTTYLCNDFSLGSVNHSDLWNQRRALLMYFGSAKLPGYIHLRFLKNDYDFASVYLITNQKGPVIAGGIDFVTNGGDTHIGLDMVKNAKFKAHDLRLRFEIGGPAAKEARVFTYEASMSAVVHVSGIDINISVFEARINELKGKLVIGGDGKIKWIDVVFYHGGNKEFNLSELNYAAAGFYLSVGARSPTTVAIHDGNLTVSSSGVSATIPVKPHVLN